MTTAYVALGANLGEAPATLRAALADINAVPGIRVVKTSSFYRTAPVDSSGPDYTNAVCKVETTLSADALLSALQTIENRHGRVRPAGVHNAPRTLDLDVLLYGDTVNLRDLNLTGGRLGFFRFVKLPLRLRSLAWGRRRTFLRP